MAYSYNHPKPLIDYTVVKKLKLKDVYWTTCCKYGGIFQKAVVK